MEQILTREQIRKAMMAENIEVNGFNFGLIRGLINSRCNFQMKTIEDARHFINNHVHEVEEHLKVTQGASQMIANQYQWEEETGESL